MTSDVYSEWKGLHGYEAISSDSTYQNNGCGSLTLATTI